MQMKCALRRTLNVAVGQGRCSKGKESLTFSKILCYGTVITFFLLRYYYGCFIEYSQWSGKIPARRIQHHSNENASKVAPILAGDRRIGRCRCSFGVGSGTLRFAQLGFGQLDQKEVVHES